MRSGLTEMESGGADATDSRNGAPTRYVVRTVKCLVSVAFWCVTESWGILLRSIGRITRPVATVIYYHQIEPEERQRFSAQLDHLCKRFSPISADMNEPLPAGGRFVAVTFDDGWRSFAETAFAELQRRQIPVTLFAVAGSLGRRLGQQASEPLISESELQSLAAKGVAIGSHTLTHCQLTEVDESRAIYELRESRRMLAQLLDREVTLFAFPFSQSNERLVDLCREAGYQRAFTGQPRRAFAHPSEFETGRIRVDPTDWLIEFHLKLSGAYRWLPMAFALKRQLRSAFKRVTQRSQRAGAVPST